METYRVAVGKSSLYVAEWRGTDKVVLGIHGLTGNHTHMVALAEKLSPEYRFIAYDVRGRGNSSPADDNTSIWQHAQDAIALIRALSLAKPVLLGHSMGAFIAAIVGSEYADLSGIVLLDGGGIVKSEEVERIKPALNRLNKSWPSPDAYAEEMKGTYTNLGLGWSKHIERSVYYEIEEVTPGGYRVKMDPNKILKDMQSCTLFEHEKVLTKINCPVLLVYASGGFGGTTPLFSEESYDPIKRYVTKLEYFVTTCNHYTMVLVGDHEEEFNLLAERIKNFLGRL